MGKFSPTKLRGDCEEINNPSTAYGRRRRNWIDAQGAVPAGQVVDARCGNEHCIALGHACVRPRVEQPGKYRKIAARVHRLKAGQHFDVPGIGIDERSHNRFRSGLYVAARLDRVSVRGQPDGSVRITKVGEWSSLRSSRWKRLRRSERRVLPLSCWEKRKRTSAACAHVCASWASATRRVAAYQDGEDRTRDA
jgi:hypothetical protein